MTDDVTTPTPNRLADESSPYLRLHRHNPVDWYPWGEEALARARDEDRPIFLSVGYSTCYWCHVMERESFSDSGVAERMNEAFVNVKVDREERPDLDEIYMVATQVLAGQGGWPNSVFLTPELEPFFAGTYFPPEDRRGMPGFPRVVESLASAWRERRGDVEEQAGSVANAMRRILEERGEARKRPPSPGVAARSLEALAGRFDERWGGFGDAPKFPTPSNLLLLLDFVEREEGEPDARRRAGEMLGATLDAMARGGIYDQLAGGFHRYATDREWKIPHFEKMLYDNGLLLEVYARDFAASGDPERRRIALETAAFLGAEMSGPRGELWSAIDAETEGEEGAYYVWSRDELVRVLGEETAGFAAPLLGFDGAPFFEGDRYVLHLPRPLEELARRRRMGRDELLEELAAVRRALLAARSERERPATDDKVLADWNGLAIGGLATAGRLLDAPELVEQATAAAEFVLAELRPEGGPLLHAWRDGEASVPAFLADYAFLVRGLVALDRATGDARWREAAAELADEAEERLAHPAGGLSTAAAADSEVPFRSREVFDGAVPSANGAFALALVELGELTGEAAWSERAAGIAGAFAELVERQPDALRTLALVARRLAVEAEEAAEEETAASDPVAVEAREKLSVKGRLEEPVDGGWRPFSVELSIAPGWHVGAARPAAEGLGPTPAEGDTVLEAEGGELRALELPPGRELEQAGETTRVYRDRVILRGEVRAEGEGPLRLWLRVRPCDEQRCLVPVRLRVPLAEA